MQIDTTFESFANIERILIIQLGDIGDVIWTIPTFLSVMAAYPKARLSVLVHEHMGDVIRSEPYIDKIFEVRHRRGGLLEVAKEHRRLVSALRRERFDLAIDLRSGDRGAVMARLSGARVRAALLVRDASYLRNRMFTHLVRPVNENIRMSYGAAEQSLRIVRGLGIVTRTDVPVLHVAEEADASVKEKLEHRGILPGHDFVTLNPFSRWGYKEWMPAKWADVMGWLNDTLGMGIVVVGSPGERARAEEFVNTCRAGAVSLAGETTLAELAALLRMGRLHIGVDSAAPHIAAAVGTPTVTIYGPTDWRDWAPVGPNHRVVVARMDCVPCHRKGCEGQGRSLCLENLSADAVKETISLAVSPLRSA